MQTSPPALRVLYEDNHLIAIFKPAGMPVQPDETRDPSLMDFVKKFLKERYQKPGNVFLGLLHRLDRPVSGIVLFAKTSKGAARLSEQFRNHTIQKSYHALVIGKPKRKSATLIHYLKKNEKTNTVKVFDAPTKDAQYCELSYETVETKGVEKDQTSLLKIQLKTGRSHQIRAQLSAIGCPIVGDLKYGAPKPLPGKSIALSATSLTFQTATTGEEINLKIDAPRDTPDTQ